MNIPPEGLPDGRPSNPGTASDALANEHDATILVVDDEPELCRALSKLLSRNGYHVLTAGNGEEGLAVLRRRLERAYCHARELHLRWLDILRTSTRKEVAELLRDRSEEAEQLRSCAPFVPSGAQQ